MKNIYIITILIIGFSISSFAGDKIGIRTGWQNANLHKSSDYGDNLSSFYLGVFKEKKIFPLFKLGAGLEYSQTGTSYNSDNLLRLHYASIPLYAQIKLGPLFVLGGAAPSLKFAESWKGEMPNFVDEDMFDGNAFDLPVFAGVGINIAVIRLEARYYFGTFDVSENLTFDGYKNRYLQLGVALSI